MISRCLFSSLRRPNLGQPFRGVRHFGVLLYTVIHPSSPDPNPNPTLILYPRNDGPPEWRAVTRRSSRFAGWQHRPKSPAFATLINHAYTARPSCIVCFRKISRLISWIKLHTVGRCGVSTDPSYGPPPVVHPAY